MGTEAEELTGEPLETWARWVMGGAGIALTVVGAIAVFVPSTNIAGVPLLILAGAGFLYAALAGQPLLNLGKDGFTFARIQRLKRGAQAIANDPAVPEEVRDRIVDAFEDSGVLLSPSSSEQELVHAVRLSLVALGAEYGFAISGSIAARDTGVDIVLVSPRGLKVGVEVKARLRLRGWAAAIRQLRRVDAAHRILVVDNPIPDEFVRAMETESISTVAFGPAFQDDVVAILQRVGFLTN